MRRLWVQLSLAFSIVVILSVVVIGVIGSVANQLQIQRMTEDILFSENGLADQLESSLSASVSQPDLPVIFDEIQSATRFLPLRLELQLRDAQGTVIFNNLDTDAGYSEITLTHDSLTVGTLRYRTDAPKFPENRHPPGGMSVQDLLVTIAITGGILGLIGGVFMSWRLARPLSKLAVTARKFGGGKFDLRAEVRGTEEVREVARAFNEMVSAISQSEQLRNNLIADVAHELRTPLSVMEGNLRAIIDDVYPLTKTEILHLYDQTRHLTRIVNDLHELALADARELEMHPQTVDIGQLLREAVDIFAPIAEADGITVRLDIAPEPLLLNADAGRLNQVIHNLLVNALRHTPEDGIITLRACHQGSQIRVEIEDTGRGIPAEHLPHVFERFYRADSSRDRATGGAGLGLAISQAIVEVHGGLISVRSQTEPPTGSCFIIQLPGLQAVPVVEKALVVQPRS